jgi:hypothetical protein
METGPPTHDVRRHGGELASVPYAPRFRDVSRLSGLLDSLSPYSFPFTYPYTMCRRPVYVNVYRFAVNVHGF